MRRTVSILIAIAGLGALIACRPSSNQAESGAPAVNERKQMKGLGQHGWASEAVVDLLKEGETRVAYHSTKNPIIIDLDAGGNVFLNNEEFAPDRLRQWLADTVKAFGSYDPVIIRPNSGTSLATLESTAGDVLKSGMTELFLEADSQLQRAYAVRLNGKAVPLLSDK